MFIRKIFVPWKHKGMRVYNFLLLIVLENEFLLISASIKSWNFDLLFLAEVTLKRHASHSGL